MKGKGAVLALADCCGRFIEQGQLPPDALHLMRSRYTAFVLENEAYLLRTWQAAGVTPEQARPLAQPLAQQTLDNIFRLGPAQALSGPIARGDWATVARQHTALAAWDPAVGQLYQLLAEHTAELAKRKI